MQQRPVIAIPASGDSARNGEWEEWMAAALTGDRIAYERLLRAMLPMLRDIARSRIADRDDAEDVVQETLLAVHLLRHTCQPERPIRPWAAAICERRCAARLSRLRRRRRLPLVGRMPSLRHRPAIDAASGLQCAVGNSLGRPLPASLHGL